MFDYGLLVIVLMLALNAVFAAYEMGLASISRARLSILVSEHKRGATDAAFMKDNMEASLAVIQLGITLFSAIAAATGGASAQAAIAPYLAQAWHISAAIAQFFALVFVIIPLTLAIIIFAELVPKMFALNNKEWIVLKLSPVMKILAQVLDPFVSVIEIVVKKLVAAVSRLRPKSLRIQTPWIHELRAALSLARTSKLMGEREEKIVLAAAHLSTHRAGDIMIPAQDIYMIYLGNTLEQALARAHLDMHTRFPVCTEQDDPQTIQGYINFKDIVAAMRVSPASPTVKEISRPVTRVNENLPLPKLLEKMIQERAHIVIVESDAGSVLGMITLEDVLEELVGEIEDEFDRLPAYIHPYSTGWIMGGGVPTTTVASTAGLDWSDKFTDRVPTLAEWCEQTLGREPQTGETIESGNIQVVIRKLRRKKLLEAFITVISG